MLTPVAYLEARDPTHNVHRAYSIAYGQDLFGNWVVETTYERIGGKGDERSSRSSITRMKRSTMCKKRLNADNPLRSASAWPIRPVPYGIQINERAL
jgi:hypothetical protein